MSQDNNYKYSKIRHDHTKLCMKYDSQPEPSENTISTSCQLCLLYVNGVYDFPNIIAEKTIQHTHGNPIWNSKCAKSLYRDKKQ